VDRQYLSSMLGQVRRVLMAFVVALAGAMPVRVHAMPMQSIANGMPSSQPCSSCPQQSQTGHKKPADMPACQIFACAGPTAMLPAPVLTLGQAFLRVLYGKGPPSRRPEAGPAPDPYPPRPIVLL
jgi:hypothetical protein